MIVIAEQEGHVQHLQLRGQPHQRAEAHARDIDAAEAQQVHDIPLVAQLPAVVHLNHDAAMRAFLHEPGKVPPCNDAGILRHLIVRVTQYRALRPRRSLHAAATCQQSHRQQQAARQPSPPCFHPPHPAAS